MIFTQLKIHAFESSSAVKRFQFKTLAKLQVVSL